MPKKQPLSVKLDDDFEKERDMRFKAATQLTQYNFNATRPKTAGYVEFKPN